MPKYLLTSEYVSFDMAPNIFNNILFSVNCSDCLSAEFIGHTSVPYNKTGKHFDFINSFSADDRSRHKGLSAVVDKSRHLGGECCNVQ